MQRRLQTDRFPGMTTGPQIRAMPLPLSVALFGLPCLLFVVLQRWVVPHMAAAGIPHLVSFLVLGSPHLLFFFGALYAYRREGWPWRLGDLAARFRFRALDRRGVLRTIAAVVGLIGSYLAVYVLAKPLLQRLHDAFPEPEILGEIMGDAETFAGFPLEGSVWLLAVFFCIYFFNVIGEELWWRGYIFPRQELRHGQRTWLVHGLLWAGFHLFAPFNAVMILPGALWVSWIVQRERNTWIFVISHGALNALAMIRIVRGILG
jgi:membrane protease YdiL (CAAX protease family)